MRCFKISNHHAHSIFNVSKVFQYINRVQVSSVRQTEMTTDAQKMKIYKQHLSIHSVAFEEILEKLEVLRAEYNSTQEHDRKTKPELWIVRAKWFAANDKKRFVGFALNDAKMNLYALTGDNVSLWPRHLRHHHPTMDTEVIGVSG